MEPTTRRFLEAWQAGDFDTMYELLTAEAQSRISREDFEARYRNVLAEATVYEFESSIAEAIRSGPGQGEAVLELLYRTHLVGDLTMQTRLDLELHDGTWRVAWTPAAIIPELGDTNRLRLFLHSPTRGAIYDRNGEPLATEGAIVTIGVVPGRIEEESALQGLISEITGLPPEEIAEKYAGQPADWFIPIADISVEQSQQHSEQLVNTPGIALRERAIRFYPQGQTAAHVVGFVGPVSAEELAALSERGYEETDFIGRTGIEQWGEEILAGRKGARLAVLTPEGQEVATLAEVPAVEGRSLYLTVDLNVQRACEEALGERPGSILVTDVTTGQLLAVASWPRYDPNIMVSPLYTAERQALLEATDQPLLNRATQGTYPSGSLFKIITMAAGMELAGLPPSEPHVCTGVWNELGFPMRCWKETGHGPIDLFHGLEQSCNVVFYETGVSLHTVDEAALQQMAERFGIGSPTGVEVSESSGLLPTPQWKQEEFNDAWALGDTVNLAIGQGFLQVTPAQMTRVVLAMATGGLLRELTVVERAEDPTGSTPAEVFSSPEPDQVGLAPEVMNTVREAMRAVAVPPLGTASDVFGDFPVAVAGKTGTAESVPGETAHAWFAGYAPYDQPQIVCLGMVESGGGGADVAAPMVRQVLERYFNLAG